MQELANKPICLPDEKHFLSNTICIANVLHKIMIKSMINLQNKKSVAPLLLHIRPAKSSRGMFVPGENISYLPLYRSFLGC